MFSRRPPLALLLVLILLGCTPKAALAQTATATPAEPELGALTEVPFSSLSSPYVTPLGTAALSVRAAEWKHAETDNFIYHFFHGFIAAPVAVEAEYYYRVVAKDLEKDNSHWERKAHIFIFEQDEDWHAFQAKGKLDPWTGGLHSRGELFIQRNPNWKFKGNSLGHETTHLVIDRFYGSNVPLWLNEGYAEYISRVSYASFNRARGYTAHPRTDALAASAYQPLDQLTNALTYPADVKEVRAFYTESEKLVRFLNAADKAKFLQLLDRLSKGSLFNSALYAAYGSQFPGIRQLEDAFRPYATQPSAAASTAANPLTP